MPERQSDPRKLSNVQNNVIHECVALRLERGFTQPDVARLLGKERSYIWKWERGRWTEDADAVVAAYAVLGGEADAGRIWRRAARAWATPLPGSPKAIALGYAEDINAKLQARAQAARDGARSR